jgi:hypothetical protein
LADDGAKESKEVDEKSGPLWTIGPVDKCDGSENDVCGKEVISARALGVTVKSKVGDEGVQKHVDVGNGCSGRASLRIC